MTIASATDFLPSYMMVFMNFGDDHVAVFGVGDDLARFSAMPAGHA